MLSLQDTLRAVGFHSSIKLGANGDLGHQMNAVHGLSIIENVQ